MGCNRNTYRGTFCDDCCKNIDHFSRFYGKIVIKWNCDKCGIHMSANTCYCCSECHRDINICDTCPNTKCWICDSILCEGNIGCIKTCDNCDNTLCSKCIQSNIKWTNKKYCLNCTDKIKKHEHYADIKSCFVCNKLPIICVKNTHECYYFCCDHALYFKNVFDSNMEFNILSSQNIFNSQKHLCGYCYDKIGTNKIDFKIKMRNDMFENDIKLDDDIKDTDATVYSCGKHLEKFAWIEDLFLTLVSIVLMV